MENTKGSNNLEGVSNQTVYERHGKRPNRPDELQTLLNTTMKIYEQIIKKRLVKVLEENRFFSELQAAYRKGRSTVDHLLVLQEIFYHYRYTRKGVKKR